MTTQTTPDTPLRITLPRDGYVFHYSLEEHKVSVLSRDGSGPVGTFNVDPAAAEFSLVYLGIYLQSAADAWLDAQGLESDHATDRFIDSLRDLVGITSDGGSGEVFTGTNEAYLNGAVQTIASAAPGWGAVYADHHEAVTLRITGCYLPR